MQVSIINRSHHELPAYQTDHAAGMDVRANLSESITLAPMQRLLIPTGLHVAIPVGYEMQVRPRSGLAYKHGITIANAPGTIDADFRGELKVLLVNLSDTDFVVKDGERIAQLIVARHEIVEWAPTDKLSETSRGDEGFGSTGS